ncbi:MAG: hypothetical protein WD267_08630 [Balneolales bacterium]
MTGSEDDDDSENSVETGTGSFTVSGDLEAEYEGAAYYTVMRLDGELVSVRIHIAKAHPSDRDDSYSSTYSFLLMTDRDGEPINVSPGTYQVEQPTEDELTFAAYFTKREGDDVTGYHTRDHGGTLTISSSSDQMIEATFEFTLQDDDHPSNVEGGLITISGEINAECFGINC